MKRQDLEHIIRAACDIAQDDAIYIFGSQAILGEHPDAPEPLRMSAEVDVWPRNRTDRGEHLNEIGEDSPFHRQFGYYVHGVPIAVRNPNTNKTHDLAASKLAAYRERDRDFVRVLLAEKLITPRKLVARVHLLPIEHKERMRLLRWIDLTTRELDASP